MLLLSRWSPPSPFTSSFPEFTAVRIADCACSFTWVDKLKAIQVDNGSVFPMVRFCRHISLQRSFLRTFLSILEYTLVLVSGGLDPSILFGTRYMCSNKSIVQSSCNLRLGMSCGSGRKWQQMNASYLMRRLLSLANSATPHEKLVCFIPVGTKGKTKKLILSVDSPKMASHMPPT